MSERTLERQPNFEQTFADEQKIVREMQQLREREEKEWVADRILFFEESCGVRIVSYNDYEKETVFRDLQSNERVHIEEITMDEKNDLDAMYELIEESDLGELTMDEVEVDFPDTDLDEEKDPDDDFGRDERDDIDRDDEMDYE